MVVGLDKFREHFAHHADHYAVIGGTACSMIFEEVGIDFPPDDRTIEVVAPVSLSEIGIDPGRPTWQMLKPLVQTALKRVGMTVDVYEGMGCGEIEFLQPAPQGCTMIVHHVDIARSTEKVLFDGSGVVSSLERYDPFPFGSHSSPLFNLLKLIHDGAPAPEDPAGSADRTSPEMSPSSRTYAALPAAATLARWRSGPYRAAGPAGRG